MMERTLVLVKPDAVARGLCGEILRRVEGKGLRLVGLKLLRLSPETAGRLYASHRDRPFFPGLIRFITSGPLVAACVEGRKAIEAVRKLAGPTDAAGAAPGSIRGDLGMSTRFNLVHASDSPETAAAELAVFFRPEELVEPAAEPLRWLYDLSEGDPL
jgi:nucleoside-diphosphate kinase